MQTLATTSIKRKRIAYIKQLINAVKDVLDRLEGSLSA